MREILSSLRLLIKVSKSSFCFVNDDHHAWWEVIKHAIDAIDAIDAMVALGAIIK